MLHDMRWQGDGCCSLFIRKGSTGLVAFKRSVPLGLSGKSPHLRVVFSAKTLCKPAPLPLFCYKKESAYSDLWTHKKNVAMDKQKVNTTSSMNRKGYSSSSHYRINPTAEKSEQVLAIKFVQWDVLPLESLCNSKVYLLRMKLNRGECMSVRTSCWELGSKKRIGYVRRWTQTPTFAQHLQKSRIIMLSTILFCHNVISQRTQFVL